VHAKQEGPKERKVNTKTRTRSKQRVQKIEKKRRRRIRTRRIQKRGKDGANRKVSKSRKET
jgi:hypothetical protein